jgi:TRAP-type mannitol/chloroaromatic compound transport system substrate-binding protein
MSQGQLKVTVYGAGEFVPAMGVFDAVSSAQLKWVMEVLIIGKAKFQQLSFLQACLLVLR